MPTTLEKTVREIALENPATIRIFESLGIDYCCGGKTPLTEACGRANVSLDRVAALLDEASREPRPRDAEDWSSKSLGTLISHIVQKHHSYVRQEVPRIETLLTKVVAKHGPAHPELLEINQLFSAIGQELSTHLMKEEQVLFPFIERMEDARLAGDPAPVPFFGTVQRPIAMMVAEHDDAGALVARIRELSNNYSVPEGACPTFLAVYRGLDEFERDLHQHIHLENNILFPRAAEMEQNS